MEKLTLVLTIDEINTILLGLQEIPYKLSDRVIKKILTQAEEQKVQAKSE